MTDPSTPTGADPTRPPPATGPSTPGAAPAPVPPPAIPASGPASGQPASGQPAGGEPISGQIVGPWFGRPGQPGYTHPSFPGYGIPVAPGRSGLAVAALVMAACGVITFGVTGPVGALLGHAARKRIQQSGEQGDGMARAAIIIGWIFTGIALALCGLLIVGFLMPTTVHSS